MNTPASLSVAGGIPATLSSSLQSQASALAASGVGFPPLSASIAGAAKGKVWGSEVPCHPVVGSLRLQAPGDMFLGWFPFPGLPWIPPLCSLHLATN